MCIIVLCPITMICLLVEVQKNKGFVCDELYG